MHIIALDVKLHPVQKDEFGPSSRGRPDCGLRELKRFKTHCALADAATALVVDRGYEQVSIDDICERARISRRTFFNYFESKDQSIFGEGAITFEESDEKAFLAENHPNPIGDMLDYIEAKKRTETLRYFALGGTEEFRQLIHDRTKQILHSEPKLFTVVMANFGNTMRRIHTTFRHYYDINPSHRRYPELPLEHEVTLSAGFVRECLHYYLVHRDEFESENPLEDAASVVTDFIRRISD